MPLEFKLNGYNAFFKKLEGVRKKLSPSERRKMHKAVVIFLDTWIQKNFQQEGRKEVGKWKTLEPETEKRRRKGPPYRVLQDVGWLRSRWKHYYTDRIVKITSEMEYGLYHDEGIRYSKVGFVQRKIIPGDDMVKKDIKTIYSVWVKGGLKG